MAVVKTRIAAAKALGVSEVTLGTWKKMPGFPDCAEGYDIDSIRAWIESRDKKGSDSDSQLGAINKAIKLQKLAEIQKKTLILQLTIDERNRDLLPREVVHEVLMEMAGLIRGLGQSLQQSGNIAAAKLIEQQMDRFRQIVQERIGGAKK